MHNSYSTMPTDGFVVLDTAMRYVKYKQMKTVEVEGPRRQVLRRSLEGPIQNKQIVVSPSVAQPLQHQTIYWSPHHRQYHNHSQTSPRPIGSQLMCQKK